MREKNVTLPRNTIVEVLPGVGLILEDLSAAPTNYTVRLEVSDPGDGAGIPALIRISFPEAVE